jgi:hypothetical protein
VRPVPHPDQSRRTAQKSVQQANVGAHPRRLRRASAAGGVGCSAVLAGFIDHVSTGMSR